MKYLTKEELVKMDTKRILVYKRKHFKACISPEDYLEQWIPTSKEEIDKIKRDWIEYCIIKEVLAHREHIERK